jgi:pimeloyl-ACP methyl ester carboxylesterase
VTGKQWDGLSVTAVGQGPGVLWLHGYTMRSAVWRPLWERLPGRRHVGLDLPWHGDSRGLLPGEDLATLADTVVAHANREGVSHIVALSFGTVLATEIAARHPTSFSSWTFAAPALSGMPHEPAVARRYRELATLYAAKGAGRHMTELWMSVPPGIFAGVAERPDVRQWLSDIIDQHRWDELTNGAMRQLVARRQRADELARLAAPPDVIVGEFDLLTHRACARSLALAARSRVHVMAGCGHLALLEEPESAATLLGDVLGVGIVSR